MSTEWKSDGFRVYAVARVCDRCGTKKALLTGDGRPAAWTIRRMNPPGWSRYNHPDGVRHLCKDCSK